MLSFPRWIGVTLAGLALGLAGCGPSDPLERKISADSSERLNIWREKVRESLPPGRMDDFNDALNEIKIRIMADGEASGASRIQEKTLERIDGKTLKEVITTGLSLKIYRLDAERGEIEEHIKYNSKLKTRPDDKESAEFLASMVEPQRRRLEATQAQLTAATEKLKELGGSPEQAKKAPPPGFKTPAPVTTPAPATAAPVSGSSS